MGGGFFSMGPLSSFREKRQKVFSGFLWGIPGFDVYDFTCSGCSYVGMLFLYGCDWQHCKGPARWCAYLRENAFFERKHSSPKGRLGIQPKNFLYKEVHRVGTGADSVQKKYFPDCLVKTGLFLCHVWKTFLVNYDYSVKRYSPRHACM